MTQEISNWWMYHGDAQHSGYAITAENANSLKLLKCVSLDGPIASIPSIVDGFAFAVAQIINQDGGISNIYHLPEPTGAPA